MSAWLTSLCLLPKKLLARWVVNFLQFLLKILTTCSSCNTIHILLQQHLTLIRSDIYLSQNSVGAAVHVEKQLFLLKMFLFLLQLLSSVAMVKTLPPHTWRNHLYKTTITSSKKHCITKYFCLISRKKVICATGLSGQHAVLLCYAK